MTSAYLTPHPTTTEFRCRPRLRRFMLVICLTGAQMQATQQAWSQQPHAIFPEVIAVRARTWDDSLTLRWAPTTSDLWRIGMQSGYTVERYLLARNGSLVTRPEKVVLAPSLLPLPENEWEALVRTNLYAAIAAQAMFGDRFEIDLTESDALTIVNKVNENEQRFSFALFASDMSPEAARASALWFTDRSVKRGEKYLYRIVIQSTDSLRGSIFVNADERTPLPPPQNLRVEFSENLVSLRWDKDHGNYYTAWKVERSHDQKVFAPISEMPIMTVSPSDSEDTPYHYALDSLMDFSRPYYYRVIGLTPFGEHSPPSSVEGGTATPAVRQPPYIRSAVSLDNMTIAIAWDFPEADNVAIQGFAVERCISPGGDFKSIGPMLPPVTRTFEDKQPDVVNYYKVKAFGLDGESYSSPLYFSQLIDSIPPAAPSGLEAQVSDDGVVSLSWEENTEPDLYGYRIFKANHQSEEPAQLTVSPAREARFSDTINLSTLNEYVYYRAMAVDLNQNQSTLTLPLKVALPDKVAPQPPVLLPVKSADGGIGISWAASPSHDVVGYALYRRSPGQQQWEKLTQLTADADALHDYIDTAVRPAETRYYTVLAIDDAGLESVPAHPVSGTRPDRELKPPVHWRNPVLIREENLLTLRWDYEENQPEYFRLYTHRNRESAILHKTLQGDVREFSDHIIPGKHYTYRLVAVFKNGTTSEMSDPLIFQY